MSERSWRSDEKLVARSCGFKSLTFIKGWRYVSLFFLLFAEIPFRNSGFSWTGSGLCDLRLVVFGFKANSFDDSNRNDRSPNRKTFGPDR